MSNSKLKPFTTLLNLNSLYSQSGTIFWYFTKCFNFYYVPYVINYSVNGLKCYFSLFNHYLLSLISAPNTLTQFQPLFNKQYLQKVAKFNSNTSSLKYIRTVSSTLIHPRTVHYLRNTPASYFLHSKFFSYKKHFNDGSLPLFSPFIKKKTRSFPFSSKMFTKKSLKPLRFSNKLMAHRKLWFLTTLLKLNKKIQITNFTHTTPFKRFLKTLKLRREESPKRKNYLIPKQSSFMNGTRLSLKGKKSIKSVLLRRVVRFYRRKLRRLDVSLYRPMPVSKNLKYKFNL